MITWLTQHVVSFTMFIPLLTAVGVLACPKPAIARWVAMGGSLLTFLGTLYIWSHFQPQAALQFVERQPWMAEFGIQYFVGVDGINLLLIVFTAFLVPCVLLSLWHLKPAFEKSFLALILALECGMLGSLVAFDLVVF